MGTKKQFIIIGAGAWGTAMAVHLSKIGHDVILIARDEDKAKNMRLERENKLRLPNIKLPENIIIDTHFHKYLEASYAIFIACKMEGLRETCEKLSKYKNSVKRVISLIKGMDVKTNETPSNIIKKFLQNVDVMCLSGPTLANDFAKSLPCAMILAGKSKNVNELAKDFESESTKVVYTNDILGVELGGCLKNVYAIGVGIIEGLNAKENAIASYMTKVIDEMADICAYLGCERKTLYGLSGLGDLLLSVICKSSRNKKFGIDVANGQRIDVLLKETTIEGYWNIKCFYDLLLNTNVNITIIKSLYDIVFRRIHISEIFRFLK